MAKKVKPSKTSRLFSKILVFVVVVLVCLIVLKSNPSLKNTIYKKVFQSNIPFAKINEIYTKYFGSSLPLKGNEKSELVSLETLEFSNKEDYKDGVKLTVKEKYLVPSKDSGLVIFVGDKEGYGKTVVVQRPDNVEVWYSNLDSVNVSLYDYIKSGSNLGEVKGSSLYMAFQKEGKFLNYKDYI